MIDDTLSLIEIIYMFQVVCNHTGAVCTYLCYLYFLRGSIIYTCVCLCTFVVLF